MKTVSVLLLAAGLALAVGSAARAQSMGIVPGLSNGGNGGGGGGGCVTSGTAMLKGNGSGGCANATAGSDYAAPTSGTSMLKGNGAGGFANAVSGTDYAPATSGTALLKGNGSGGFANATAGTDYAPPTSGSSILKGNGSGGFSSAVAGTDYMLPSNNLSDVTSASAARASLGLGTIATLNSPLPLSAGGNGCGAATTFANRDQNPAQGETCGFTDAQSCAVGQVVKGGGTTYCDATYISGTYPNDVWLPAGGGTGTGSFTHALPATGSTLAVTGTSGTPSVDWYSGTLTANSTYTLPTCSSNCVDNDTVIVRAVQGTGSYTIAFNTLATGGIEGPTCPQIGTSAGNQATYQFVWNATRSSWTEYCGGTVPQTAVAPANGLLLANRTVTANYTATAADSIISANVTGGSITITLPQCTGSLLGKVYWIEKIDSSNNYVTIQLSGTDTFDNGATSDNLRIGPQSDQFSTDVVQCAATGRWNLNRGFQMTPVWAGGTGRTSLATGGVLIGENTDGLHSATSSLTGAPLLSQGSGVDPSYASWTVSGTAPALENRQFLRSGTSYTVPSGCSMLLVEICGGGGGGGGVTTGGTAACAGASGSAGSCALVKFPSPSGTISYSLGAAGTAGTNGTTPTAGGNGGASTITLGGQTLTLNGGPGGGASTVSSGTCTAAGAPPAAGALSGNINTAASGADISVLFNVGGTQGQAGSASTTVSVGGSTGNRGGNGGAVNSSGAATATPTAGDAGFADFQCIGATAF